jgi:hypothetical protein
MAHEEEPGPFAQELAEDENHVDDHLQQIIVTRVWTEVRARALVWRLRFIAVESVILAALTLAIGLSLELPGNIALPAALMVGAASLIIGLVLIALSSGIARLFETIWSLQ